MIDQSERDDVGHGPLSAMWVICNLAARVMEPALRPYRMTSAEYVLASLLTRRGGMTPTDVASRTAMAPTTVSYLLRRMQERGHLTRVTRPEDRRSVVVQLTQEGVAAQRRASAAVDDLAAEYRAALTRSDSDVREVLDDAERALRGVLAARDT